jgi:hypothetical protein
MFIEKFDAQKQKKYFFNTKTKSSVWKKPAGFDNQKNVDDDKNKNNSLPEGWVEKPALKLYY